MAKTSIANSEPHFTELLVLWEKNHHRRTKAEIFAMWEKMIKPDVPQITVKQFINYTRNANEKEKEHELARENSAMVDKIVTRRDASLIEIEQGLRSATSGLVDEANNIMEMNKEDGVPLKERYFALAVIEKIWGKVQKEKEIAIKAHAEKRESVGMFAKLLRGAMSGEFTMKDVETMRQTYGHTDKTITGAEGAPAGAAQ